MNNRIDSEFFVTPGNVILNDLELRADALNALKLPITVKAGRLGSLTIKASSNPIVSANNSSFMIWLMISLFT